MVCAAGSLPGDLHKLWRTRHPKQYHLEYGYSCMGYEIAGGLGVKMADPEREVYVLVGDGSYLMLAAEIVTSVQEGYKLTIVLMDNHGYKSIGALSRSLGSAGLRHALRLPRGRPAAHGRRRGGRRRRCPSIWPRTRAAWAPTSSNATATTTSWPRWKRPESIDHTVVIYVENDRYLGVPGYESWWDVPVAEVSEIDTVNAAREEWEEMRAQERYFL